MQNSAFSLDKHTWTQARRGAVHEGIHTIHFVGFRAGGESTRTASPTLPITATVRWPDNADASATKTMHGAVRSLASHAARS